VKYLSRDTVCVPLLPAWAFQILR